MNAITSIEEKLKKALDPSHLEVIDESYLHNVEPGRESHVRIVAISNLFEGLNLVKRPVSYTHLTLPTIYSV